MALHEVLLLILMMHTFAGAIERHKNSKGLMFRTLPTEGTIDWEPEDSGASAPDCIIEKRWCKILKREWDKALAILTAVITEQKEQAIPTVLLDCYYHIKKDDSGWWLRAKWETKQFDHYWAKIFFQWGGDHHIEILAPLDSNMCSEQCIKGNGCNFCRGKFHCDCVPEMDCVKCFKQQSCYSPDRDPQTPCLNHTAPYIGGAFRVLVRDGKTEPRKWTVGYVVSQDLNWGKTHQTKRYFIRDGRDDGKFNITRKRFPSDPLKVVCPLHDPIVLKQGQ